MLKHAWLLYISSCVIGDGQGDEQLTPASTHTPLEHQAKLRAMATSTAKLLEETAGYMASVQVRHTHMHRHTHTDTHRHNAHTHTHCTYSGLQSATSLVVVARVLHGSDCGMCVCVWGGGV